MNEWLSRVTVTSERALRASRVFALRERAAQVRCAHIVRERGQLSHARELAARQISEARAAALHFTTGANATGISQEDLVLRHSFSSHMRRLLPCYRERYESLSAEIRDAECRLHHASAERYRHKQSGEAAVREFRSAQAVIHRAAEARGDTDVEDLSSARLATEGARHHRGEGK